MRARARWGCLAKSLEHCAHPDSARTLRAPVQRTRGRRRTYTARRAAVHAHRPGPQLRGSRRYHEIFHACVIAGHCASMLIDATAPADGAAAVCY